MRLSRIASAVGLTASFVALAVHARAQTPPSPTPAPSVTPTAAASATPAPAASPTATPSATAAPAATPSPTPPPISVQPDSGTVPVGQSQTVSVNGALGTISLTVKDPSIVDASINQDTRAITLSGKAPGATTITIADQRGVTHDLQVRVAYNAGVVQQTTALQITGDPASAEFVRSQVAALIRNVTQARPGAQVVVSDNDVPFSGTLGADNVVDVNVPVLVQGNDMFSVNGTTRVRIANTAAPRIAPVSLMVSDYPEKLTENGELFTADLLRDQPSRFLYFHYNPPGQPDRRIVLRAENHSPEPAIVQFISGPGGPGPNEMEVGHQSSKLFAVRLVQNEGNLIQIPGNSSINLVEHLAPAGNVVCNLLQLRVLNGAAVHLTLFAQSAADDPRVPLTESTLLTSTVHHARGIYRIPEFTYSRQWSVNDEYLELPVGLFPLANTMNGEALSGDYGVLESFVVNVQNPLPQPQSIAIYENPRGGRSTGTYLIDGVLVQSHQVPPYSRYKIRQYVIPARGFVRVTITTLPEGGSNYPLRLVFAPDDGSVPPGAPGSPVY